MRPSFYKRTFIIILLTLTIIVGPTSCFFFETCPEVLPYFQVRGLNIYNFRYNGEERAAWDIVNNNELIKYDNYFMRVNFEKTYLAQDHNYGGQNLYALSCEEPGYRGSKVGIDTLYLITQQDYNSEYLRGDTINQIIQINYYTYYKDDYNQFFPLTNFLEENRNNIQRDQFDVKIVTPPLKNGDYEFKLILVLKDGEKFEQISEKVALAN